MLKRVVGAAAFTLLVFVLAVLYVGGVAALSDRVVHLLRPGPSWAPLFGTAIKSPAGPWSWPKITSK
jgi:hypothetical protein